MIIRSGVRNVVVGMRDPNPLVSGRGIAALRREGINVRTGVMREACADLNRFFVKQMTTGLPFVHLKMAQTLDGKIGLPKQRLQITGPASRRLVHRWRAAHDAVLVGAGTITADDPQLTVRMARGRDPHVVILDGHLRSPASSRIFRQSSGRKIIVCTTIATVQNKRASVHALETAGAVILSLPGAGGHLPLKRVLRALSGYGIGSLLVEGGANVFGQFIRAGLVDQCSVFVSPAVIGNGIALPVSRFHRPVNLARRLPVVSTRVIDQDILIQYFSRQR
jgi:diaminohydroxyphosphoribosylaminopyrimidine deaminase/5-amino-6-(5-phosphoribosylamino)uracil reductase